MELKENTELKEKLAALREGQGLTQGEVAEEADVARQTVSRWERGTAVPSMENLITLSRLYGVSLDELVNGGMKEPLESVPDEEEAKDNPPVQEETPTKRRNWWKVLAVCLAVLLAAVTIACSAALYNKGEETPSPLPMEDMEQGEIDISNAGTLIHEPVD